MRIDNFPEPALRFEASNLEEYNRILDNLVMHTYINIDYHIKKEETTDED
jgi:hypothetical protein